MTSTSSLSSKFAAGALLWVVLAVLALFFVPMVTEETVAGIGTSEVVTVTKHVHPLIDEGWVVRTSAVAVAAALLGVGLKLGRPSRRVLFVLAYVSLAFCFVTGFSIGLLFVPVPLLLFASAATAEPNATHRGGRPSE